jgi:hypothetical protein
MKLRSERNDIIKEEIRFFEKILIVTFFVEMYKWLNLNDYINTMLIISRKHLLRFTLSRRAKNESFNPFRVEAFLILPSSGSFLRLLSRRAKDVVSHYLAERRTKVSTPSGLSRVSIYCVWRVDKLSTKSVVIRKNRISLVLLDSIDVQDKSWTPDILDSGYLEICEIYL